MANAAICIAILEESIYTFIRFEVILRGNFGDLTAGGIMNFQAFCVQNVLGGRLLLLCIVPGVEIIFISSPGRSRVCNGRLGVAVGQYTLVTRG